MEIFKIPIRDFQHFRTIQIYRMHSYQDEIDPFLQDHPSWNRDASDIKQVCRKPLKSEQKKTDNIVVELMSFLSFPTDLKKGS